MIELLTNNDIDAFLLLVKEVEPLFGQMAENKGFLDALEEIIASEHAFCIKKDRAIAGAIVISPENNAIAWLAIAEKQKGNGYATALVNHGLEKLDKKKPVSVQTFSSDHPEGVAARKLYEKFGFREVRSAGKNPAGISTIIMEKN